VQWEEIVGPLRDRNARRSLAFHGLFGLFLFMGLPFYSVFALRGLGFSLGTLTVLTTLANLAGLVSVSTWAPLCDRFGVKPVMTWSLTLWTLLAAGLWLVTGTQWRSGVYPSFVVYGFMWTLFQLLQFNFMLKMAPRTHPTSFISTFFATTYLFWLLGPILGGHVLAHLPEVCGHPLGAPLTRFHVVFVGSMALCLATLLLILRRVHEPDAASVRDLARHLRSSADANPLLFLVSAAQELFGQRAIESLLRRSRHHVRRQTMALADIGADLAGEGWRTLRRPLHQRSHRR
jgi:MFS family permease